MRKRKTPYLLRAGGLLVSLLLAACGPAAVEIEATVNAQVSAAVAATVEAMPTATPLPTLTAYPTFTPYPTLTPEATQTPRATYTPYPTYTPLPTETPLPTDTPTATATATRVNFAASVPPTATSAAAGFTDAMIVLSQSRMGEMMAVLGPRCQQTGFYSWSCDYTVDCPGFLSANDRYTASVVPPVTSTDANVQNAYNSYKGGIDLYNRGVAAWLESCRAAVAAGESRVIAHTDWMYVLSQKNEAFNLLEQARRILSGG